ncbi:MAG: hypothetical protein V5A46_05120 [Haloferacaceae archaeon]
MQHSPRSLQRERSTESSHRTDWTSGGLLGYVAVFLLLPLPFLDPTVASGAVLGAAALGILARVADR